MKILLPFDGSDCATKTLQWTADTFRNAEYYLLYVLPVSPDLNATEFDIMDATAILRKARSELEERGCTVADADYTLGDTVSRICGYADEMDADQVVLGSHGHTGLSRMLMGSVSVKVLEHCHRPVTLHRNVERKATAVAPSDPVHVLPYNAML